MVTLLGQLDGKGYAVTLVTLRPGPLAKLDISPSRWPRLMFRCARSRVESFCFSPGVCKPWDPHDADGDNRVSTQILIYLVRLVISASEGHSPFDVNVDGL